MKPLKTLQIRDDVLSRFQDNVRDAFSQVTRLPLLDGNLIEGISLVSGSDNRVAHKLGRVPRLWFVVDLDANAVVWRADWDNKLLTLNCDSNCNVSLWVA